MSRCFHGADRDTCEACRRLWWRVLGERLGYSLLAILALAGLTLGALWFVGLLPGGAP